jgi:glycosyltransferase involved in cell wall biosynthesis
MLLSAWKEVYKKHPDWQLYIYGGGNRDTYINRAKELGIESVVRCEGPVNNITEKYLNSSLFILSSRFEGLPLVLMEAMSAGLAPVAFACPCGPKDIIKEGENGLLCDNGNTKELASKICELIENDKMRKELGQNAANSIKSYSLDNIMHQWNDLFQEIYRTHAKEA